jgi:polysaccharide biosynthesis/export protein
MTSRFAFGHVSACLMAVAAIMFVSICGLATSPATGQPVAPPADMSKYIIGPGDSLEISVWHNPELSTHVPVRPDGRISTPLVVDLVAAGRTPEELGHDIEARLKKYVNDPLVTVIVSGFVGQYSQQIRIVGEAQTPKSLPYQAHMTVLDAMIAVGGLTPYASGNRAKLVRHVDGKEVSTTLRLSDLLKSGDLSANTDLQPGDVIIIPQSFF